MPLRTEDSVSKAASEDHGRLQTMELRDRYILKEYLRQYQEIILRLVIVDPVRKSQRNKRRRFGRFPCSPPPGLGVFPGFRGFS